MSFLAPRSFRFLLLHSTFLMPYSKMCIKSVYLSGPCEHISFPYLLHYYCQRRRGSCFVHSSSSWGRWVWPERSPWRWTTGAPCCCCCGSEEMPWSLRCHCCGPPTYPGGDRGRSLLTRNSKTATLRVCTEWEFKHNVKHIFEDWLALYIFHTSTHPAMT